MRAVDRSYVVGALVAAVAVGGLVVATRPTHPRTASVAAAAATEPLVAGAASATVGVLRVTDAYVPQPASDAVAAAYFTVTNPSGVADALVRATTDVSSDVGLHDETVQGGAGVMTALTSIAIPAHGSMALVPDHRHVMIENPSRPLTAGDRVRLTLTFATAGTVTLAVPVVPLSATLGSDDDMSGMG